MDSVANAVLCKNCQTTGEGKFCSQCGQPLAVKRISFHYIVHEVFHYFTHLDKGILYTLKMLVMAPGKMQLQFLEGDRARHQKPVSMYFLTVTVGALLMYWINYVIVHYYHSGDAGEVTFFNKYMVMLLLGVVPFTATVAYMFFYKSGFNFPEIAVLQLYSISFFMVIVVMSHLLKFIWPGMQTRFVEVPLILLYNAVTFVNFFRHQNTLTVILRSIICGLVFFGTVAYLQDMIVTHYLK